MTQEVTMSKTTTLTNDQQDAAFNEAVDAIKAFRTQADQWQVADSLAAAMPPGTPHSVLQAVRARAERAGVKPLGLSAMRQYSACSTAWPAAKRIDGVNYSCHRAALGANDPHGLLKSVVKIAGSPSRVTVKAVNEAVLASKPNAPVAQTTAQKTAAKKVEKAAETVEQVVITDELLVRAIGVLTDSSTQDRVSKLLAAVGTSQAAVYVESLNKMATKVSKAAGLERKAPKSVGGKRKAAPKAKAKAPAKRKAPRPSVKGV